MYLAKTSGNLNPRGQQPQSNLQNTTVRSFEGGLNVTDTDLNMSPKYAKMLDNLERDIDGSLSLRPGTKLFSNKLTSSAQIVNCVYFNGFIITVQTDGRIHKVAGDGTATHMLRTLRADNPLPPPPNVPPQEQLPPAPPWNPGVTIANFTISNSDLIIVNGRDKPVIISGRPESPRYMEVEFLIDPATTSNIRVPIGKYIITHGKYTIIAGVLEDPGDTGFVADNLPATLYVSGTNTNGVYYGAGSGTDAIRLDVGPRVSLGSAEITGLVSYRDKLLVTFERGVLPMNLGIFTGDPPTHTPTDDGFVEEFGCLTHRSLSSVGDDVFYCDNVGVNSITRVNVFNTLRPVRASHLIDPLITNLMKMLTQAQIQQYVFSVYDLRHFRYMLFIPMFTAGVITETVCFSYSNIPTLKIAAWARLRGWRWQAACRTALQNIIFARGNKLYSYDFDNDTVNADLLDDPAVAGGTGVPIMFEWEMPWTDLKHRMDIKQTRYLGMDTQGQAKFTVETYVDNIERVGTERVPLLRADFLAGDSGGYGNSPYGNSPYGGGGRRTADERLFAWPAKFKLMKLRFTGTTKAKLKFISISVAFLHGSIRR